MVVGTIQDVQWKMTWSTAIDAPSGEIATVVVLVALVAGCRTSVGCTTPATVGEGGGEDTAGVVFVVDDTILIEVQRFQDRRRCLCLSGSLEGSISMR